MIIKKLLRVKSINLNKKSINKPDPLPSVLGDLIFLCTNLAIMTTKT